jgi:methionyl-tRNA formyltransferase
MKRIALLGFGGLALSLGRALLQETSCELCFAISWSTLPKYRGTAQDQDESAFRRFLAAHKIPQVSITHIQDPAFIQALQTFHIDIVLVASWGEKIPTPLLESVLWVNCHPSLLPKRRGSNPVFWSVRAGDQQTGVTFHTMDAGWDTGPIWQQEVCSVYETDTGHDLRERLNAAAAQCIPPLLSKLHDPQFQAHPQNEAEAFYDTLKPFHLEIHWEEDLPGLQRLQLAAYPWYLPWTKLGHRKILLGLGHLQATAQPVSWSAGTLLQYEKGHLWVASGLPEMVWHFQYVQQEGWPLWLCKLIFPFVLLPGRQFHSAIG